MRVETKHLFYLELVVAHSKTKHTSEFRAVL